MVERFVEDGFVRIEGAFPPRVAEDGARLLWKETGYDPDDPGTWEDPVRWVSSMAQGPFAAAANSPVLHRAFDLLVGERRWLPRYALGSFPCGSRTRTSRTTRAGTSRGAICPTASRCTTPASPHGAGRC